MLKTQNERLKQNVLDKWNILIQKFFDSMNLECFMYY